MNGMNAYLALTNQTYSLENTPKTPDPHTPLLHLLKFAHESSILPFEGAWRLHKTSCQELESRTHMRPVGGWRVLCSLAAGARMLRAGASGFLPDMSVEELMNETPDTTRRKLLESFTVHLAPPGAAAGLFLLMSIHPVWGLRIAHASNQIDPHPETSMRFGERDETIFPQSVIEILQDAVYATIACVVATLRQLDPGQAYSLDTLATLLHAISQYSQRIATSRLQHTESSLPAFLPSESACNGLQNRSHLRVVDFSARSFLESVFIPAGALRRFDDGTFCIFENAFDAIQVGTLDTAAQNNLLQRFLSDLSDQHQVA